jgi:hypothetical protein
VSERQLETRRVDVVILTALPLELDAVLAVDAGAVAGSWPTEAIGVSRWLRMARERRSLRRHGLRECTDTQIKPGVM